MHLQLSIPSVEKIKLDHGYTNLTIEDKPCENISCKTLPTVCLYSEEEKRAESESIIKKITLTETQIEELEKKTKYQSKDAMWFEARKNRITGSKCGRLLIQKQPRISHLQSCMYPKPFKFSRVGNMNQMHVVSTPSI